MESVTAENRLHRELSPWAATAFVVSNMIGTGIFTVPAIVRVSTGSGLATLLVWTLGGGLALCGALCYAELSTRMPEAGGEYQYLSRVFGPMWGFVSGWISFLAGFSAAIAASALGATAYAASLLGWRTDQIVIPYPEISLGSLIAAGLIVVLALFHSFGVRPSGQFQTIIAAMVITSILLLIVTGFLTGRGDWHGVVTTDENAGVWWVALIQVSFAYSGWNAASYLAGEVREPNRTLPRALIGGTLIVALLYLGLNLLFLYAVPAKTWGSNIAIGSVAAEHLFGTQGSLVISAIITVAILGSVSAMTAAGPRVYYAMSRDGLAPAIFSRLGKSKGVPTISIFFQATAAVLLVLTGKFETLLIYIGSALSLVAALTVTAVWFVRRDKAQAGVFLTPGYPVTPAIFLGLELVAFLLGLRERPIPTGAALITILIGVGAYLLKARRGTSTDQPR